MTTEIAAYNEFRAQIAELKAHNSSLVFDYTDPKGNKEARSHIYKLRQTNAALDRARKAEKAASLEYGRQVDSQAAAISAELEAMIQVHQAPLDAIEAKEKARVEKHQQTIVAIQSAAVLAPGMPEQEAGSIKILIEALEVMDLSDMQEFAEEATRCRDESIRIMRDRYNKRVKYDADQAELAELRRKADEQAKKDHDAKVAQEAAEREQKLAEAKAEALKKGAEEEAKRLKDAADKKLLEERLKNERLQREKAEAEQRAKDAARETEERLKREAAAKLKQEADELAKREANKRHVNGIRAAAEAALVNGGLSVNQAAKAIELIDAKKIPHVAISY